MTASENDGEFSASYDTTTKIVSAIVCGLAVLIPIALQKVPLGPVVGGLGIFALVLAYAYSPRGYRVAERAITVRRLIGAVRIPLEDVRAVRIAEADDFRGCVRLWGSGGLFGYYGLFHTSKLGKSTWYLTSRRNRVVVITGAKTAVFSPHEAERFVEAIRAAAPISETPAGEMPTMPQAGGASRRLGVWIGVPLAVLGIALATAAMTYSPGPPRYTQTPDALTIHDRFYPVTLRKGAVDVARIRVVDFAVDGGWRPDERTDGFANSHYQSGWFRAANGQRIRMYRAGGKRLVLLPPRGEGAPVLLEVRNAEGFVAELRREWGG
ncbi:MAG: PH domain-containing protein [Bryobacteraceae bacterium]